jgi:2-iminobutanoate/2-iminopropanoate deaminase
VLDGMQEVLKEAGMTMDDLATVTVYCPDVSLFNKFNGVYRTYFKRDFPARAFIGSGPLLFGGHFEVQAIAVKPEDARMLPLSGPKR